MLRKLASWCASLFAGLELGTLIQKPKIAKRSSTFKWVQSFFTSAFSGSCGFTDFCQLPLLYFVCGDVKIEQVMQVIQQQRATPSMTFGHMMLPIFDSYAAAVGAEKRYLDAVFVTVVNDVGVVVKHIITHPCLLVQDE